MNCRKKYDGKKPATLDDDGRPIPKNLELNSELEKYVDPSETKEDTVPYYKLKMYLKYELKEDDKKILATIVKNRMSTNVQSLE